MNRLRKAYRAAIDTYRLTRFRQKTESTAFGLARRHGIELKGCGLDLRQRAGSC